MSRGMTVTRRDDEGFRPDTINEKNGYWVPVRYENQDGWAFSLYLIEKSPPVYFQEARARYFLIESNPGANCSADDVYRELAGGTCSLVIFHDDREVARFPWIYAQGWIDEHHLLAVKGDAHAEVAYGILYSFDIRNGRQTLLRTVTHITPFTFDENYETSQTETITFCEHTQIEYCCTAVLEAKKIKLYRGSETSGKIAWERQRKGKETIEVLPYPGPPGLALKEGSGRVTEYAVETGACTPGAGSRLE